MPCGADFLGADYADYTDYNCHAGANFLDADDADAADYNLPCGADLGADYADSLLPPTVGAGSACPKKSCAIHHLGGRTPLLRRAS